MAEKGLEMTFNTVFTEYDRWRPTYVPELYRDIFAYKNIDQASKVLEIGIGTGQASRPILDTGCSLTAVELGDKLAEYTRHKFSNYRNFEINNTSFQDFEFEFNSFDLIYSATAFHWIPEDIGYRKVYDMLKSGGAFARFANRPYKDKKKEELHAAIQDIYAVYMPGSSPGAEFDEEAAKKLADIGTKYGFVDVSYRLYHRTRTFSAREYVSLLGTYSDHIAVEEQKRSKFFAEIQRVIEDHGGQMTLVDTIDLQLSRKP